MRYSKRFVAKWREFMFNKVLPCPRWMTFTMKAVEGWRG